MAKYIAHFDSSTIVTFYEKVRVITSLLVRRGNVRPGNIEILRCNYHNSEF